MKTITIVFLIGLTSCGKRHYSEKVIKETVKTVCIKTYHGKVCKRTASHGAVTCSVDGVHMDCVLYDVEVGQK